MKRRLSFLSEDFYCKFFFWFFLIGFGVIYLDDCFGEGEIIRFLGIIINFLIRKMLREGVYEDWVINGVWVWVYFLMGLVNF